jgi:hypothetical protein
MWTGLGLSNALINSKEDLIVDEEWKSGGNELDGHSTFDSQQIHSHLSDEGKEFNHLRAILWTRWSGGFINKDLPQITDHHILPQIADHHILPQIADHHILPQILPPHSAINFRCESWGINN